MDALTLIAIEKMKKFSEEHGHKIVGNLCRHREWELSRADRTFFDDAKNEYYYNDDGRTPCILIAHNGGVI